VKTQDSHGFFKVSLTAMWIDDSGLRVSVRKKTETSVMCVCVCVYSHYVYVSVCTCIHTYTYQRTKKGDEGFMLKISWID